MNKRIFSIVLIYFLIYINLALCVSASEPASDLSEQISQLDDGGSWEHVSTKGEKLLGHPELTAKLRFDLLSALANAASLRDDFVSSEHYLQIIKHENVDSPLSDEYFFAAKFLATTTFYQGRNAAAIGQYLDVLQLASQRNKPLEQANIHNNLGLVYITTNELESAIYHYSEAQNLFQKYGRQQDQADILLNMSGLYIKQYRYDIAEEMLTSVLKMFADLNDENGTAIAHAFMGELLSNKGENDKARHHHQTALEYYQSKNDTDRLMAQYAYLANISIAQGNFEQAQKEANFAFYYAEKISNLSGKMQALLPLAKAYFVKGDLVRAKQMVDESLSLAQTLGAGEVEPDELATLALIQAGLGDYEESIRNFNRFKIQQYEFLNENVLAKMVDYQNRIEAAELNREITELKQKQAFQALQIDKREQVIWLSAMVVLSLFIAVVSLYFKQAEKNAKVELKVKVAERTAELQRVADELREASQVKNQFLANISHEIRTPLTSIIGQAEAMLNEHGTNRELKDSLGVIQRQGKHLKELVSDVLDLSRIEAQRFDLEYSDFTLQTLLDDINGMFNNACMSKGLNFNIQGDFAPAFTINLDYMRLKQILINLLGNAVKFTERGRVTLHIDSQPAGIVFKVIDTGIGMNQEQLGRVFESFQQGDNSITRRFGGSGLGLCLSQQLTEMMGGSISVNSELDVGSEFTVFVPCSPRLVENTVPLEAAAPVALAHGKVLVAEDHDDNRALFERILGRLGLEVVAVSNGEEAVERCLVEYPDVVLMDIQMPIMDGVEALNLLRQSGFEQPVYALTANVMEHEIQSYLDAGFYGHLGKPLDTKVLQEILHQHLGSATQAKHHAIDMSDLVASFASSLPSERDELIDLWERKDWLQVQKVCHRLSGAASTFEFSSLANTSRQLERMLIKKQFKQAEHLYLILCDELNYISLSEELDAS